jgi:hypothetical protein
MSCGTGQVTPKKTVRYISEVVRVNDRWPAWDALEGQPQLSSDDCNKREMSDEGCPEGH